MQLRQVIGVRQEMVTQPQQILRSELIQTPLLQLEARFQQEFEQNPLLEIAEEIEDRIDEGDDRLESNAVRDAVLEGEDADAREAEREEREPDWEQIFEDQEDDRQFYKANRAVTEPVEIPQADVETLADTLRSQLRLDRFDDQQMEIGEIIIGSLDSRGYLDATLDILAGIAKADEEVVEEVLWRIQRYDPPGIAARSLQECLMIQAELLWDRDHLAYKILSDHYDSFINRRYESIANALDVSPQEVQESFELISQKLNPRPGEGVINEKLNYIIPDLIVEVSQATEEDEPEFLVMLNDGNIPSFYINEELKKLILKRDTDKKAREYAVQKAESARWFINAIMQRRTTMVRTMRAIVDRQKKWFLTGKDEDLKPMILQDIADEIEMDISTISRVTRDKYVQTPYGVRELKFYFNDRMETSSGDEVATRAIKSKLREIIEAEEKKKPLSDQAIADLLEKEGFPIARRTVQKYREQLGIPVKRLRRQV